MKSTTPNTERIKFVSKSDIRLPSDPVWGAWAGKILAAGTVFYKEGAEFRPWFHAGADALDLPEALFVMETPDGDALSPQALESHLAEAFPPDASDWLQAGDEVRDMCRAARELAGVPDDQAVNFRQLNTPAQWNRQGVAGIVASYVGLSNRKRREFCERFAHVWG